MLRLRNFIGFKFKKINCYRFLNTNTNYSVETSEVINKSIPNSADVIIIGGGSAGCHLLYHLAKRGVKAILLERAKLTAGTTWHTAGLIWRLRPNDVDIHLLNSSRNLLINLEKETGLDSGWIQNGGLFIAHSNVRMDEYKRLSSIGSSFGIENHILSSKETQKIFPLLDSNAFDGALYSPGDGVVDPAMLCAALTRYATTKGCQVIEECPVTDLLVEDNISGIWKNVKGVSTLFGPIKSDFVINATGVWGNDLLKKYGITLPLVPMRHAYVISEPISGVRNMPNVRDHDYSIYFRIQGESICMGGYENNPILLDNVPKNFNFGLYNLDYNIFESHIAGALKICPAFGKHGIKSDICGPESFTPDHKPLMGPDINLNGLFHHCGFNSAGMMFGGGCAEQMALWIINGKPDLPMFQFDLNRFTKQQTENKKWTIERSHESYAKNYSIVFPHDQPLAGRNFKKSPLHEDLLKRNAWMEEKQGWERPGFFLENGEKALVNEYDWYGSYGNKCNDNVQYNEILNGNLMFDFSKHHDLIGEEALNTRKNAGIFDMSYFCKMYLTGREASEAANWLFTGNIKNDLSKTTYTCILNNGGGVEADVTVSRISSGTDEVHNPKFNGDGFYVVSGGASAYYTYTYILSEITKKGFKVNLKDVTEDLGIISIQGPKSRTILQKVTDFDLSDTSLPPNHHQLIKVNNESGNLLNCRILRVSFIGELGYELHIPKEHCSSVYNKILEIGECDGLKNAGFRALYSLSSEKGYHLWGFDLRSDDTPIEANLGFTCRKNGLYKGKDIIDKQRIEGIKKRLVYFTLKDHIPIWGLEGVYRNGEPVGIIRRGEFAYTLKKSFGQAYIERKDGKPIDIDYIKCGKYEIDIMGKLYEADCHLRSPFDPKGKRLLGIYDE